MARVKVSEPQLRLVAAPGSPAEALTFEQAFRRYGGYVGAIVLRITGVRADVPDLTQNVFLEAHRGWASLRDPAALKGWLATIAVRIAKRYLHRRRVRRFIGMAPVDDYREVAHPGATPEQHLLLAQVYRVLEGVAPNERIAWTLRHVEGERLDAVARTCECSLATVKRRIASTQAILEEALKDA